MEAGCKISAETNIANLESFGVDLFEDSKVWLVEPTIHLIVLFSGANDIITMSGHTV
jgi:hypothetical protein